MLDLHRLRLLRELDARSTVRAAAEALGYTTSAVSQQLAVLEREAGTALFERVGRNLRLTEAGRVLVRHAQHLLDGAEAAEAEVAQVAAGRVAGVVRVSSFQSAFLRIVAPSVRELAEAHPHVRVEASELEVEQGVPALRLQHLDVVVGTSTTTSRARCTATWRGPTWCANASGWSCPWTTRWPGAARCLSPSSPPSRGPRASP